MERESMREPNDRAHVNPYKYNYLQRGENIRVRHNGSCVVLLVCLVLGPVCSRLPNALLCCLAWVRDSVY